MAAMAGGGVRGADGGVSARPEREGLAVKPGRAGKMDTTYWKESTGGARAMRYLSLLYTGFFVIQPIYEHSVEKWIWFGVVYAVFLFLYFTIPNVEGRLQQMLLTQMFALAFSYFPVNQSASGLFVYPIVILAFVTTSMRLYVTVLVLEAVGIALEAWLFHLQWWAAGMGMFFALVVGFSNFAYTRQRRSEFQLSRANDEIEHLALVAERERIARDLHDLLGHTLTVIAIKSELANRLLPIDAPRAAQEMQEVEQTARKALAEVREAVTGYRSEGIAAEVQRARRTLLAAEVQLLTEMETVTLTPAQANVLCLLLREAVTNIVRHAQASTATLRLVRVEGRIRMRIEDDGVGVSRSDRKGAEGNGLRGMRERVGAVGGVLEVSAGVQGGMVVTVELPVEQQVSEPGSQRSSSGLPQGGVFGLDEVRSPGVRV